MNFGSEQTMNESPRDMLPEMRPNSPLEALADGSDGGDADGDDRDGDASDASYHAILEQVEGSSDTEHDGDGVGGCATSPPGVLHNGHTAPDGDVAASSQDGPASCLTSKPSTDHSSAEKGQRGPQGTYAHAAHRLHPTQAAVVRREREQPSTMHVLIQRLAGKALDTNRVRDARTTRRPNVFSAQWSCSRMEYSTITDGGLEGKRTNSKKQPKLGGLHFRGDDGGKESLASSSAPCAEPPEVVFATELFGLRYASTDVEDAFVVFLYRGRRSFLSFCCVTVSAVALAASVVTDAFDSFWIGALLCLMGVALFGIGSVNYIWFVLAKSYERRDAPKLATSILYEQFCISFGVLGTVALAVPHYPLAEVCIAIGHYELVPTVVEPCVDYMAVLNLVTPIMLAVLLPLRAKYTIPIVLIAPWILLLVRVWYPAGSNITAWLQLACQTALALGVCLIAWCNDTAARRMFADSVCIKADVKRTFRVRRELDRALEALLPKYVVRQMSERRSVVDHAEVAMVSVCEIHDFANWTTTLLPADIVHVINALYMAFDEVVWRYELDKMKAVGDRYIVTSGLQRKHLALTASYEVQCEAERQRASYSCGSAVHPPSLSTEDRQQREMAIRCVRAALIQLRVAAQLNQKLDTPLKLKVVLHCGPLLGALVGSRSISYDMFGPTLEIPLRMATHIHRHSVAVYSDAMRLNCDGFFRDAPLPPLALVLNGVGEQLVPMHCVLGSSHDMQLAESTKPIKLLWPGMNDDATAVGQHPTSSGNTAQEMHNAVGDGQQYSYGREAIRPVPASEKGPLPSHCFLPVGGGRGATTPSSPPSALVMREANREGASDQRLPSDDTGGGGGGAGAQAPTLWTPASLGTAGSAVPDGFCIPSTMVSQLELRRHPMASSGASTSSTAQTDGTDAAAVLHGRLDMSLSLGSRKSIHSRGTPSLSLQQHPLFAREVVAPLHAHAMHGSTDQVGVGSSSVCSSVDGATTAAGASSVDANLLQAVSFFQEERYRVLTEKVLYEKENHHRGRHGAHSEQLAPAAMAIKQHLEAMAAFRFLNHRDDRRRSTMQNDIRRSSDGNPLVLGSHSGSITLTDGSPPDETLTRERMRTSPQPPPPGDDQHSSGFVDQAFRTTPSLPGTPLQPPPLVVAAAAEPVPLHGRRLYHDIAAATRTIRGTHVWGTVVRYRLPELEDLFDSYQSSAVRSVSQGAYVFHMVMCLVFVVSAFVESMYLVHTHNRIGAVPRPNAAADLLRGVDILAGNVPSRMNSAVSLPLAAVSLVVAAVRCTSLGMRWRRGRSDRVDSVVLLVMMVCTMLSVHAMPENALNMDAQYLLLYFLLLIGAVVRFWYHAALLSCIAGALALALQSRQLVGIRDTMYVVCLPVAIGVCTANVFKERYFRTHFEALWLSSALLQAADDEVAVQRAVQTLMFPRHVLSVVNNLCLGVANPDMVFLQSISDVVTLEVRLDTVTERVWRQRHHPLAAIDFAERSFYIIETLVAQANEAARRRQPRLIGSRELIFRVHSCGDSILYAGSLDDLKDEDEEGATTDDVGPDDNGASSAVAAAEVDRRAFASWKHATVSSPVVHVGQGGKRSAGNKHTAHVVEDDEWVVEEKRSWECSFAMMEVLNKLFQLRKRSHHERITARECSAHDEQHGSAVSTNDPAGSMTCVVCSGSGFATVLGSRRVTFDVFGVVTRQSSTLLQAAPPGFFGCSDTFRRLLSDAQANASGVCGMASQVPKVDVVFAPPQPWRVRGAGVMVMHTLVDASNITAAAADSPQRQAVSSLPTSSTAAGSNANDGEDIEEEVRQATQQYHNLGEALPVNFAKLADSPAHSTSTCTDDDGELSQRKGNAANGVRAPHTKILRFDFVEGSYEA